MSKIEKNIQLAREWLKKHGTEALDLEAIKQALSVWESKMELLEASKVQLKASKEAAIAARKQVAWALATAKIARKATPKIESPELVSSEDETTPVKSSSSKKSSSKKSTPKKSNPQP